ncbi:MAG: DUF2238 domain-containing protein [Crocinitomicaceae bacterium]|nr:DUF2238 domain-containing protein [Crocinitomicaceae bacterium]
MIRLFKTRSIKLLVLTLLFAVSIVFSLNSEFPKQQLLQHLGTLAVASILFFDLKARRLSLGAFFGVSCFILLHIIGAKWIYSFVPYQNFFNAFGFDLHELFGLDSTRNHYDRFVHFSFGVFMFPFVYEIYRYRVQKVMLSLLLAWLTIQTFSLLYEVFEWMLTLFISGEGATDYNGQQGDIWDAQKDMALAMLGSTLMTIVYFYKVSLKKKK